MINVSTELPKFTIQALSKEPSRLKKTAYPLLVILSFCFGYFGSIYFKNNTVKTLNERNDVLEEQNNTNQDKLIQQNEELSLLKTEQKIKQEAVLQLQNNYKDLIKSQNKLKSEIDFYERLLSPNSQNKGLRVFESKVLKHSDKQYSVKIILVQKLERAKEISGKYKIEIIGKKGSAPKTLQISSIKDIAFKFKYFHNISLDFSLPEGFNAEQLVVRLFPSIKKAKTIEYSVDWQSIIK